MAERIKDYVNGEWIDSLASETREIRNPATGELLAEVPMGGADDIDRAVKAANAAFDEWRMVPPAKRARYLFTLKNLLEENKEELSRILTMEHGKTLSESRGSVQRGIECVEVACGAPSLLMGQTLEDVATGIDCESVRQPMGVFACIAPFNFPAMVPLWFYPFAVACGNSFICKPSEQVPLCQRFIFGLIDKAGFPPGVLNLVNGGKDVVNGILEHPDIKGVSFVGSSPVAKHVYTTGAAHGKRVQALGGAKNFMIVMPDADMGKAADAIANSAYGCAGERCLAASLVLAVDGCEDEIRTRIVANAKGFKVGNGMDEGVTMGPVISASHLEKVEGYVQKGVDEGADLIVDGRGVDTDSDGHFIGPCVFDNVTPDMVIAKEEIFGPVLGIMKADSLEDALEIVKGQPLANACSIFTTSGKHARTFKYRVEASMAGVNIGVVTPMSFFGFGGAKGSFFGDLKAHGRESFDFYTDRKVLISRWD